MWVEIDYSCEAVGKYLFWDKQIFTIVKEASWCTQRWQQGESELLSLLTIILSAA